MNEKKEVSCRVCGEPLGPAPVLCPECDTPHHWDCWEYNGGCAVYACSHKFGRQREKPSAAAVPLTGKIPFPRLQAGTFLGLFYVTESTFAICLLCAVFLGLSLAPSGGAIFRDFKTVGAVGVLLSIFWAAMSAETYNLNMTQKALTKSKLLLGREIYEWPVVSLAEVEQLEVRPVTSNNDNAPRLVLVARLKKGSHLELTPPFEKKSEDEQSVLELLSKLEGGSMLKLERGLCGKEEEI